MLKRITIRGWGPHEATTLDLDPKGPNIIAAPSMWGKSTLVDAVSWCLWGVLADGRRHDVALIRDGADAAEVEVELGSGTTYRRRVTRAKTVTRWKGDTAYTNAVAWNEALGPLGKHPELSRVTLAPLAWCPLAEGEGGGRPLRDLLASVLPSVSLRDVVAGLFPDLRPTDSTTEADVFARRAEANRARDEAKGRLDQARSEVDRLAASPVTVPDTSGLRDVLDRARRAEWHAARAALGDRPAAKKKATKPPMQPPTAERSAVAIAEREVAALERRGDCPTCGQPMPHDPARVEQAQARLAQLRAELEQAEAQFQRAEAFREAQLREPDPGAEWDLRFRELGSSPGEPCEAPAPDEVEAARAGLRLAQLAEGAAERWTRELESARARLTAVESAATTAAADARRLDQLLDAVRKAPSEQARRIVEALGDLGPVGVRLPETGPAIEVLVDGRPWWTASTGRLVVADLYLRAALRRAQRQPWLCLMIDDAQAWSGELPDAGPSVVLRTMDVTRG